jgi:hypothetical protein
MVITRRAQNLSASMSTSIVVDAGVDIGVGSDD